MFQVICGASCCKWLTRECVSYIEVFDWDVLNDVVISIQTEAKSEYAHREDVKVFRTEERDEGLVVGFH